MKSKKTILSIIAVLFVVFNVIAFAIPTQFSKGFWVAYAFTVVAFVITLFIWLRFFKTNENLKSKFINLPILNICAYYIVAQIVVFLVFKFAYTLPVWVSIIVNIVILAIAIVLLMAVDKSADYIEAVGEKVHGKVVFIKSLTAEIEGIAESVKDDSVREKVDALAEAIRFSDPMSDPSLEDVEKSISDKISTLKNADEKDMESLIADITVLINDRNRKCKILK